MIKLLVTSGSDRWALPGGWYTETSTSGAKSDDARLAYFLRLVPGWMRVAVEFRHSSWRCEEIFALLEEHRAAFCVMSVANLP